MLTKETQDDRIYSLAIHRLVLGDWHTKHVPFGIGLQKQKPVVAVTCRIRGDYRVQRACVCYWTSKVVAQRIHEHHVVELQHRTLRQHIFQFKMVVCISLQLYELTQCAKVMM